MEQAMSGLDPLLEDVFGAEEPLPDAARIGLERLALSFRPLEPVLLELVDAQGRILGAWPALNGAPRSGDDAGDAWRALPENETTAILSLDDCEAVFMTRFEDAGRLAGFLRGRVRCSSPARGLEARLADLLPAAGACGFTLANLIQTADEAGRCASRLNQMNNQYEALRDEYCRSVAAKLEAYDQRLRDQQRYATQLEQDVAERTRKLCENQLALENYANRLKIARDREEQNAMRLAKLVSELEEARKQAEQAVECKSAFLANMSHEIRTPLTAILGFTDLLKNDEELDDPVQRADALATIRRNGRHLLELINDILDLSKIEADRIEVERIHCSPADIMRDVRDLMKIRTKAKGLTLTTEFDGPVPRTIASDPTRLRQILINLVGNAVKFTEAGSVRLTASLVPGAEPPLIRFDVIDSGIGISNSQIATLFQPFTQADSSTTRRFGGTGLGLSICKRLAELLGGQITVASRAGQGSTFSLTVPTGSLDGVPLIEQFEDESSPEPADDSPPPAPAKRVLANCRVLLAEDGADNQRLISFFLAKAGAEVTVVENGQLAVERALFTHEGCGKRQTDPPGPFDVILMDMQMPVLDGYGAAARIREEGCNIPIVALTANTMQGDREKCLAAGCNDYLAKPIDRQMLIDTVVKHFSRHEPDAADAPLASAL